MKTNQNAQTELYPLHLYRVRTLPETCPHLEAQAGEFLAPSPLVAAFLFAPYGFTHHTLEITLTEENPEIGEFDHDQLEIYIREHFVFGTPYYAKMTIEEVFSDIESCMADALADQNTPRIYPPAPKAPTGWRAAVTAFCKKARALRAFLLSPIAGIPAL